MLTAAVAGAWILFGAWRETSRREAYLPDLEAQARHSPEDGRLLALLGARLAQAGDRTAVATFERAVGAGAADAPVWIAWAASEAALGNIAKAQAVLRAGIRAAPAAGPSLQSALDRCRGLGTSAAPGDVASAIAPEEDRALLREYAAGSFLNGLAEWWGRGHPEESGFATRERWALDAPRDVSVQVLWGRALLTNRRLPEAAEVLRQALELDPDSPEAHLAFGDLLLEEGALVAAAEQYQTCLRLRADWLPALVGFGNVAVRRGAVSLATELFLRATRQAPDSADAWIGLGRTYYRGHQLKQAVSAFEKAARLAPDRTDFLLDYAETLRLAGQLPAAEALLRRRMAQVPEDAYACWLLAGLLTSNQPSAARAAEAEQLLRATLPRVTTNTALLVVRLSQILLNRGEAGEAILLLEPVAEGRPGEDSAQAAALLARAYRMAGRPAEARAAQAEAERLARHVSRHRKLMEQVRLDPRNPRTHRELAALFREAGDAESARRHLEISAALEAGSGAGNR